VKAVKKAPAMSTHQTYFNQMRQKLTRNFNKTFGRSNETINKQPPATYLNNIDKSHLIGNTPREEIISNNDKCASSYLRGKFIDRKVEGMNDFDVSYNPYELAAKQMRELMEESLIAKRKGSFSRFSTKEFTDHEWDHY